ncbi:MAG: hypothetical protein M5U01_23750 [Ardenticatenaceae bacterium]|nr:hypothetical protein [Ardenticatenaceae bacterium]
MLRVTFAYDLTSRDFDQDWKFLNLESQLLSVVALGTLQPEIAHFYPAASRGAHAAFSSPSRHLSDLP